ncbi:hypothetical protein TNIN_409711 [Trichonephila inaurata madagascariensis]|uniref:Methyltransferase domain-containing protein n=1 Tax=Trichonephila inaurata madagascariensis TaxID=2747483 RepID=A0A8X6MGJ9_9ARAC|nr:hypothetical protein TNIN_409711 [Trichonephila inaurata madagascariensis]
MYVLTLFFSLVDFRFSPSGPASESICHTLPKFQKSEMAQAMALNERLLEPARELIARCITELNWEDLSEDTVMDIGCGGFFLCTRALLEKFPRMGCLLAVDKFRTISNEIKEDEFFAEYFRNNSLQFHLADITDSSSLEFYRGLIHKIVSRNMLQHVTDKEMAFQHMYDLLRPGGHAAVLFCIENPVETWRLIISTSTNWEQYRRNEIILFYAANLEDGYYENVLEDIGFRVVRCERSDVQHQFENDQTLLTKLLSLATIFLKIPEDKMTQFKEESVKLFKELIGYSGSGPLRYEISDLLLLAIKP